MQLAGNDHMRTPGSHMAKAYFACLLTMALVFFQSKVVHAQSSQQDIEDIFAANKDPPRLTISIGSDGNEKYFIELLQLAFSQAGETAIIETLSGLTHKRETLYLQAGKLTLVWRLASQQRDKLFKRVNIGLTGGKIGQRVFFIVPGEQHRFAGVKTAQDMIDRKLVGGFGENWFDIVIWRFNRLPSVELPGSTDKIFSMLEKGNRGFDYFSRGITEILAESQHHPELAIESSLLFKYNLDFYFYLSRRAAQFAYTLEYQLKVLQQQGVMEQLMHKHFGDLEQRLNLKERQVIQLALPP